MGKQKQLSTTHQCPQSIGRAIGISGFGNQPAEIYRREDNSLWELSSGDAGIVIAYCPFCGRRLGKLEPLEEAAIEKDPEKAR